jgi:hypothetical protein
MEKFRKKALIELVTITPEGFGKTKGIQVTMGY